MVRLQLPAPGTPKRVTGLPGCAPARLLAGIVQSRCVLAVMRDEAGARRLHSQLAALGASAHHIAGWEMLPYDAASPPRSAVCARSSALARLRRGQHGAYVVSVASLMLPTPPPQQALGSDMSFAPGQDIDLRTLQEELTAAGCSATERVRAPGEYAVYGGQVDVFPAGSSQPYRLVLDDLCIEQIRSFDPATQLSTGLVEGFELLAARDYPLDAAGVAAFRNAWRERIAPGCDEQIYELISNGVEAEGAEFLLPLFYGGRSSVMDYLRKDDVLWLDEGLAVAQAEFGELAAERFEEARSCGRAALPPEEVFANASDFAQACEAHPVIELEASSSEGDCCCYAALPPVTVQATHREPYARLQAWLRGYSGRVVLVAHDASRRVGVLAAAQACGIRPQPIAALDAVGADGYYLLDSPLSGGFVDEIEGLAVVTEAELHDWRPPDPSLTVAGAAANDGHAEISPGERGVSQRTE